MITGSSRFIRHCSRKGYIVHKSSIPKIPPPTLSTVLPSFSMGVCAKTVMISAMPPLLIQILEPFRMKCSPSGASTARVLNNAQRVTSSHTNMCSTELNNHIFHRNSKIYPKELMCSYYVKVSADRWLLFDSSYVRT